MGLHIDDRTMTSRSTHIAPGLELGLSLAVTTARRWQWRYSCPALTRHHPYCLRHEDRASAHNQTTVVVRCDSADFDALRARLKKIGALLPGFAVPKVVITGARSTGRCKTCSNQTIGRVVCLEGGNRR